VARRDLPRLLELLARLRLEPRQLRRLQALALAQAQAQGPLRAAPSGSARPEERQAGEAAQEAEDDEEEEQEGGGEGQYSSWDGDPGLVERLELRTGLDGGGGAAQLRLQVSAQAGLTLRIGGVSVQGPRRVLLGAAE
jgi:hypothetical protein